MWTPPSLWRCVSFCPISCHKSTGGRSSSATSSRRRSTGRSRRVAAASRRSGRSARRAGPREARFVHVVDLARQSRAMVFAWWNPCIIRPRGAADGGAGGELRGRASLVTVDVLTGHICSVSFCFFVPTERDKYVWLVQNRRRPVDQDLEGGLTRQCNTRLSFLIMCCVWESLSQDDDGGLRRSRWTCSRSGRSARRAGPNAAGCACHLLQTHILQTCSFILVSA